MRLKRMVVASAVAIGVAGALVPAAHAADATLCLSAEQQRLAIAGRKAVPLGWAVRTVNQRLGGEVIRARLCNSADGLVYRLTVLSWNGRVVSAMVDASTGALIGGR